MDIDVQEGPLEMGGKLRVSFKGFFLERWKMQSVFQKDFEIREVEGREKKV